TMKSRFLLGRKLAAVSKWEHPPEQAENRLLAPAIRCTAAYSLAPAFRCSPDQCGGKVNGHKCYQRAFQAGDLPDHVGMSAARRCDRTSTTDQSRPRTAPTRS